MTDGDRRGTLDAVGSTCRKAAYLNEAIQRTRLWRADEFGRYPAGGATVGGSNTKPRRPLWVQVGLWGLPSRGAAWAFFWLSIALAVASAVYGLWDRRFLVGVILLVAALWYWASIRWVDRDGSWA